MFDSVAGPRLFAGADEPEPAAHLWPDRIRERGATVRGLELVVKPCRERAQFRSMTIC